MLSKTTTELNLYSSSFIARQAFNLRIGIPLLPLCTLSLAQQRELEAIVWIVGAVQPDGKFNCQNGLLPEGLSRNLSVMTLQ
jgi:hypothetical protein